ncbi:MAG: hypothetical protein QM771_19675 [Nitrospira sp.]
MLPEILLFAALHGTQALPVSDKIPYESAEASAKLFSEDAIRVVKGVILDTTAVRLKDGVEFVQMEVETDRGPVRVHLGPTWYMNEYHDRFDVNKGRLVTAVCSPAMVDGKQVLVAAELTNADGQQRMRLRHPDGTPAWVGGEHAK